MWWGMSVNRVNTYREEIWCDCAASCEFSGFRPAALFNAVGSSSVFDEQGTPPLNRL